MGPRAVGRARTRVPPLVVHTKNGLFSVKQGVSHSLLRIITSLISTFAPSARREQRQSRRRDPFCAVLDAAALLVGASAKSPWKCVAMLAGAGLAGRGGGGMGVVFSAGFRGCAYSGQRAPSANPVHGRRSCGLRGCQRRPHPRMREQPPARPAQECSVEILKATSKTQLTRAAGHFLKPLGTCGSRSQSVAGLRHVYA